MKKTDYNTKVSETEIKIIANHDHDRCIISQEFNKLTSENCSSRLARANLASKRDIANIVKKADVDDNKRKCI